MSRAVLLASGAARSMRTLQPISSRSFFRWAPRLPTPSPGSRHSMITSLIAGSNHTFCTIAADGMMSRMASVASSMLISREGSGLISTRRLISFEMRPVNPSSWKRAGSVVMMAMLAASRLIS